MKNVIQWLYRNLHLLVSLVIVVPTAVIYGAAPASLLPQHLDIQVKTVDLSNFMRAIMCLYVGVSLVWLLGILQPKYWKRATQLNALFMLSLGFGRLLSMFLDGLPSGGYIFGVIAEVLLGIYALLQLKKQNKSIELR